MARNQGNIFAGALTKLTGLATAVLGDQGEQISTELHGKWYSQAAKGKLFEFSTAIAGTIIPVNASNLVSTFTLVNPASSGVNLELVRYKLGLAGTTTAVIGNISLAYQSPYVALATLSLGGVTNLLIGSGTSTNAQCFPTGGTFTGTPSLLGTLGLSFGTTGASPGPVSAVHDFDGAVILKPGTAVTTVANAAQTQAMAQSLIFAEVPTST